MSEEIGETQTEVNGPACRRLEWLATPRESIRRRECMTHTEGTWPSYSIRNLEPIVSSIGVGWRGCTDVDDYEPRHGQRCKADAMHQQPKAVLRQLSSRADVARRRRQHSGCRGSDCET